MSASGRTSISTGHAGIEGFVRAASLETVSTTRLQPEAHSDRFHPFVLFLFLSRPGRSGHEELTSQACRECGQKGRTRPRPGHVVGDNTKGSVDRVGQAEPCSSLAMLFLLTVGFSRKRIIPVL